MKQYMIDFTLPTLLDDAFMQLIPDQRLRVYELFIDGKLLSYSLNHDRSKLWATMRAKNRRQLLGLLNSFPLTPYMTYEIHELMFNELAKPLMPNIVLN